MTPEHPATFAIPEELRAVPPRAVYRRADCGWGLIGKRLFLLPHMLIGIGALMVIIGEPLLIALTPDIPAVVTRLYEQSGGRGGRNHHIAYAYSEGMLGRVTRVEGDEQISADEVGAHRPGEHIFVYDIGIGSLRYSFISRSSADYIRHRSDLWFWATMWNGIFSVFFYILWVQPMIRRRLVRDGQPVAGKITHKYTVRGKGGRSNYLTYEFDPIDNQRRLGKSEMTVTRKQYDLASEGDAVTILYDPARISRSIVYEYSDFRAVGSNGA